MVYEDVGLIGICIFSARKAEEQNQKSGQNGTHRKLRLDAFSRVFNLGTQITANTVARSRRNCPFQPFRQDCRVVGRFDIDRQQLRAVELLRALRDGRC